MLTGSVAIPADAGRPPGEPPLLEVRQISKRFPVSLGLTKRGSVSAVEGLSLVAEKGSTVGIVGESGCGKSTAARLILGLIEPDEGEVVFEGESVREFDRDAERRRYLRRNMQMVFQDPHSSLNPRASIGELVAFPLKVHGFDRGGLDDRVGELLEAVGLHRNHASYYPHQLSGGQRQRVNIARAVALDPKLVVCDEAVSALDKSVQAQVLELLLDLRTERGLTYLFISHDLNVVEYMSDVVIVMYLGQAVEACTAQELYADPRHPYTRALLSAIPSMRPRDDEGVQLDGELPSPLDPPPGCRFQTRCPEVMAVCRDEVPAPVTIGPGHQVACHLYEATGPTPVELPAAQTTTPEPLTTKEP